MNDLNFLFKLIHYIYMSGLALLALFVFLKFKNTVRKLKKTQEQLEEAKTVLEIRVSARTRELSELADSLENKVKERTQELRNKVAELEKFNKLAIGRELKMMELKEEIKKLKEELEKQKD